MPSNAEDTAEFLLFMDKAFDSVNGSKINPEHGKNLRCAVSNQSEHEEFWHSAIKAFESKTFF